MSLSDSYCLQPEAMDRMYAPPVDFARLRARLAELNRLRLTPERLRERAAIVRAVAQEGR